MGRLFSVRVDLAMKYGCRGALMIQYLHGKIKKNRNKKEFFKDGKYWVRTSYRWISEDLRFWSGSQVRRIIEKLKKKDAITVSNFNEMKFNTAIWISLKDENVIKGK